MFKQFEYFSSIIEDVEGIKAIYRISGLAQLEEVLGNIRDLKTPCIVVKDSGDGFLNLRDRRFDSGYHHLYVFDQAKVADDASRLQAKRTSFALSVALFDRMKDDAVDFGDVAFGLDDTRIDYAEIGPIADECYGYSFGYTISNEF